MGQLAGAWIQLNWSSPVQVTQIVLWDRPNLSDNVQAGTLSFSDGSTLSVGQLPNNATSGFTVSFSTKTISSVRFTVTQAVGSNIGLAEFQVFGTFGPPVISGVQVLTSSVTANVSWKTDQLTTGAVNYGLSSSYGATVTDNSLASTHSLALAGLTCNALYHYQITATGQSGKSSSTADATFTTGPCGGSFPVSDNFDAPALNTNLWTFVNPAGDALLAFNGSNALLTVPHGTSHDAWTGGNQSARLMQAVPNGDFVVELRLQSAVMFAVQEEGILVQQDNNNFLRFDVEHNGTSPVLFAAGVSGSTATTYLNTPISSSGPPFWLRVQRAGDTWTESWSLDGTNFTAGVTFNYPLNVTEVGPFAGNSSSANGVPALTASIDYFFNTASPLSNLDGPLPFTRIVIDPNPPPTTLEKGLGDIDGDGRLDAVIGFGNPPGTNTGDGLVWYENPHSGNPADPWLKHTILASGVMYEDLKVVDVNGDGAPDVIASFIDGTIYWFENPRGFGGNPGHRHLAYDFHWHRLGREHYGTSRHGRRRQNGSRYQFSDLFPEQPQLVDDSHAK